MLDTFHPYRAPASRPRILQISVSQTPDGRISSATGKVVRKKRMDRHKIHIQFSSNKADKETSRRYQHGCCEPNGGWKGLTSNNQSKDIKDNEGIIPLMHPKEDIYATGLLFQEHTDHIIDEILSEVEKCEGVRSDLRFRVEAPRTSRGSQNWKKPSKLVQRPRL
ncbi:hypothetical protein BDW02DRAFT_313891 [Decorospora gaudefroyi]|uniref:Uncharacterized protein n=1 Tax=Decorospora gaudefroyi TaxID=184978 RepID=A0A6A5KN54_9PLEO|nr:hypothetical protein BDW02DRAFT_313891 [Decorospora gaudefroyi]